MSKTSVLIVFLMACGGTSNGGESGDDTTMDPGVDALPQPVAECQTSDECPAERPVCSNGSCNAACAGIEQTASFVTLPTDIIWVVDQSGSMTQETQYVQAKINDFVNLISATNIDYRVTMIATPTGTNLICVPGPLGGPSCGNNTRFRLVNQRIGSHDGPSLAISKYASYSDFLRTNATKHFVFVTDDNSTMSATSFMNGLAALMPSGMFDGVKVHAIYAYGTGSTGCTGPFGTGAADGTVYTSLVSQTQGQRGVICQDDWSTVFTNITQAVISGSQVACELAMPVAPQGESIDPAKVNVKYQSNGSSQTLTQVQTAADCAGGGWYYDDNTTPTKITLCASTCSSIQSDPNANLKLELGCATQIF